MAYSTRTVGIIVASVISVVFIAGAYLISGPLPFHIATVNAQSTHDLLVSYAAKDSDNDGLPDWEEVLYGTDPNNAHSVSPTLTDGEAVAQGLVKPKFATATTTPVNADAIPGVTAAPQTLTDQFAQQLFQQYLTSAGGTQPTPDQVATFVETGVQQLIQSQQIPDSFSAKDERVTGSGPDALAAYDRAVEAAFAANTVPAAQSELIYFSDAVNKNDSASLAKVKAIGTAYGKIARAVIKVPVPNEAAAAHLELANGLMHMSEVTLDMATINTDPLRAMLGLAEYQQYGQSVVNGLQDLHTAFVAEQVTFTPGTPGADFYQSMVDASQPAPTKP